MAGRGFVGYAGVMEAEEGILVESGSFRVDRAKALEKLSQYQLENPALFTLSWVRVAVGSGAKNISFDFDGRTLEIRFDGRALPKTALSDPYGGLFAEVGEAESRLKHLAFGVLGSLRLSASEIRVVSGTGADRRRLIVSSLESERIDTLPTDGGDGTTAVRIVWPRGEAPETIRLALGMLFTECETVPGRLTANGKSVRTGPPKPKLDAGDSGRIEFDEDGIRGWLDAGAEDAGDLQWYHAGVFVTKTTLAGPLMGVSGTVDSLDLNLTASLSGLVQDAAYRRVREAIDRMGRRLLLKCAGERARLLERHSLLDRNEKWQVGFGRRTHWILDQCAIQLKGSQPDSTDSFKRALWRVPLFSDMRTGGPVSISDLFKIREDTGSILVSDRRMYRMVDQEDDIIWVPDDRAFASLERLFGPAVRRKRIP